MFYSPHPIKKKVNLNRKIVSIPSFFDQYAWTISSGSLIYEGPMYSNGSGSRLYYDEKTKTAYQFYAFW